MRWLFVIFELLLVLVVILCFIHARNRGRSRLVELITLIVYGVILEELTILFFREYTYGRDFLLMVQDVPIGIGLGWAAIIYSAMETSDRLGIPASLRPLFDTLLALNIDLSMDAIAIRAGFWNWSNGGAWFGVPYGNFFGWICVVFFFSLTARWLRGHPPGRESIRVAALLAGSIVPLIISLGIWKEFVPDVLRGALVALILLAFLAAVLFKTKGGFSTGNPDYGLLAVPFIFHVFFLALLFTEGIYLQVPALVPISVGMLLLGLAGHFPRYLRWQERDFVNN
ncbi:MAG: carotenoid biosynthesis protein [Candidatus Methanoperedens sp.]|nr:carotenoid biosynthesis protein [Candidatus Methanoperedens sp.]